MPERSTPAGRINELDSLRGIAALAVVVYHFTTRFDQMFERESGLSVALLDFLRVDLFFMLSGFVILIPLERTKDWAAFAWARFCRLYPAYWVGVGLTFTAVAWFGLPGQAVSGWEAALNLTMIQSMLGAEHVDGAYWSLQAEVIFYANILLLHQLGCLKRPLRVVMAWLGVSVAVLVVLHLAQAGWLPTAALHVQKLMTLSSLRYIPMFGIGILLYAWRYQGLGPAKTTLAGMLCLLVQTAYHGTDAGIGATGFAVVMAIAAAGWLKWLSSKPLVYLGSLSYPLYVTHQNIGYILLLQAEQLGWSPAMGLTFALAVVLAIAAAVYHGIEKPAVPWLKQHSPVPFLRQTVQQWAGEVKKKVGDSHPNRAPRLAFRNTLATATKSGTGYDTLWGLSDQTFPPATG